MKKKIFAEVYGCPSNVADYEIVLGLLKKSGYKIVDDAKKSDLNIIFTCVVKTPTANKMIHRIRELMKLNEPLIVTGCMPKTERHVIEKINPRVSMLGPDSIKKVCDVARATLSGKKVVFTKDLRKPKVCLPRIRRNDVIHITQIGIGCRSACSYCCVRFARGRLFSYPADMIVKEIKQALKEGCKEIWITSQDNGTYKFQDYRLPDLLNRITEIHRKFLIRIGMMNPTYAKDILGKLIESYCSERIFKFLHLPVQSGSNKILRRMNRNYRVNDFRSVVKKFRRTFPSITISTDIIVGFPGEEKKDYQKTIQLIEGMKPDIVNISKFGPRPGTEAAKMEQLSREIINNRTKTLVKLVEKIKLNNSQNWLGWGGEVLIDEMGKKGGFIGRNFAYKPVLTEGKLGTFKKIKIKSVQPTYLIGQ